MKNFIITTTLLLSSTCFAQETTKIYSDKEIDSLYNIIQDKAKSQFTKENYKKNLKCLNQNFELQYHKNFKIFDWARPSFMNNFYWDCVRNNWNKKSIKKWDKAIQKQYDEFMKRTN